MVNKKQDGNYSFRQRRNATSKFPSQLISTNRESKGESKSKTKAAPLSKYRRKTANARERTRMREINTAFENLRKCVPQSYGSSSSSSSSADDLQSANEKLTKITTLRLAMMYIRTLSNALANNECHTINLDRDDSIETTKPTIDCDIRPKEKIMNRKEGKVSQAQAAQAKSTVKKEAKRDAKQKQRRKMNAFEEHNYSDFTSYSLESDGESLGLSEEYHGHSPLQSCMPLDTQQLNMAFSNSVCSSRSSSSSTSSCSLIEEPLDLILPDLDSDENVHSSNGVDFSAPFFTASGDLDCIMNHPFSDLFSDLVAESTFDYLI